MALGKIDKVFEALEDAYNERLPVLVETFKIEPYFDPIRSDPRYKELIRKIGLPDD